MNQEYIIDGELQKRLRYKGGFLMKKIVQAVVAVCMMLMSTQLAFANADKVTIAEGADITAIHRLAVAAPLYVQVKGSPSKDEVTKLIFDASAVARSYVLSYDLVAQNIQKDAKIDIKALERRNASKVYKEQIGKYADAYVVTTVANNSKTVFFFDVYKAGTNDLIYTYQIVGSSNPGSIEEYTELAREFYKNFEHSAQKQLKDRESAAKAK